MTAKFSTVIKDNLVILSSHNLSHKNFSRLDLKIKTYLKYDTVYFKEHESVPSRDYFLNLEENLLTLREEIALFFLSLIQLEEVKLDRVSNLNSKTFLKSFISLIPEAVVKETLKSLDFSVQSKAELIKEMSKFSDPQSTKNLVSIFLEKLSEDFDYLALPHEEIDLTSDWNTDFLFELSVFLYFEVLTEAKKLKKK